jgi:hypothetical protein
MSTNPAIQLLENCRLRGIVQISEGEAGTAEHAPEAPEVVGRHRAGPSVAVVMAVYAAGGGAAARVIELLVVVH